jgi:hypothetical protein
MSEYYDVVVPREAEAILDFTIQAGESLLTQGVADFGEILSWINIADLSLEVVPSCRESLNSCLDWNGTNGQRVDIALSILRDAMSKIDNPLYSALLRPSEAYLMLIDRVCGPRIACTYQFHHRHLSCLSLRDYLEEEQ